MEERLEEQENDAENLEEEKSRLNDKIGGLKKDVENLEDNLRKVWFHQIIHIFNQDHITIPVS